MTTPSPYVMNEAEAKLVEALESGRYKQAQHTLRDNGAFCCLGVACDISGLGHWTGHSLYVVPDGGGSSGVALPDAVLTWLGWKSRSGLLRDNESLAGMNDDGATFAEIAQAIRAGKVVRS